MNFPGRPDWLPRWDDQAVAVVACGKSASKTAAKAIAGKMPVIVVKEAIDLFVGLPQPEIVYGCDFPWWRHRVGLPKFPGLKVTYSADLLTRWPEMRAIGIEKTRDELVVDRKDWIGSGGNSGFQALNLAILAGARAVLLIGFDCNGEHYYGRNNWPLCANPADHNFHRWIKAFTRAAQQTDTWGIDVVNISTTTSIRAFRHTTIDRAFENWDIHANSCRV